MKYKVAKECRIGDTVYRVSGIEITEFVVAGIRIKETDGSLNTLEFDVRGKYGVTTAFPINGTTDMLDGKFFTDKRPAWTQLKKNILTSIEHSEREIKKHTDYIKEVFGQMHKIYMDQFFDQLEQPKDDR